MASGQLLKLDALGAIERVDTAAGPEIVRVTDCAWPGLRGFASWLARREARILSRLAGLDGIPVPLGATGRRFSRTWLAGEPMHRGPCPDARYFRDARRLLRRMHRAGVTHNDLAKEANWLRRPDGGCAVIDFQLAVCFRRRHRWFRLLAHEDLRHLLKHKRHYLPDALTTRERALLARPSAPARLWRAAFKPCYRLITRRLLRLPERSGAEERGARPPDGSARQRF